MNLYMYIEIKNWYIVQEDWLNSNKNEKFIENKAKEMNNKIKSSRKSLNGGQDQMRYYENSAFEMNERLAHTQLSCDQSFNSNCIPAKRRQESRAQSAHNTYNNKILWLIKLTLARHSHFWIDVCIICVTASDIQNIKIKLKSTCTRNARTSYQYI